MNGFPNGLLAAVALLIIVGAMAAAYFVIYTRAD
jgi:hypothetical protein